MKTMNQYLRTIVGTSLILAFTSTAVFAASPEGVWRGKLEVQNGIFLTIGYTIENGVLTLDSPNQGMFAKAPTSFTLSDNELEFIDAQLSASFTGEFEGDTLTGTFTQGKAYSLTLHRLDSEDLERMAFEGRYAGEMLVNRRTELPLQVNVAVLHDGYYATLDSPAQQSYGIPLTDFSIVATQMSFSSPMISASYSGTYAEGGYHGDFLQGQKRSLTLSKVAQGEEPAAAPK